MDDRPQETRQIFEMIFFGANVLSYQTGAERKPERLLSYIKLLRGDDMRKTYTIDLKVDFSDDARHAVALKMMRKAARMVLTQATMIADKKPPQVAFRTEDFFEGTEDLQLVEVEGADDTEGQHDETEG